MTRKARIASVVVGALLAVGAVQGQAQAPPPPAPVTDKNFALPVAEVERLVTREPMTVLTAEISRPKAKGDITLKAEATFGDHAPFRVKVRKSEPGAESFNNVPRYDLAAYRLQGLFLDPQEYVVPPTALRMMPLSDLKKYSPDVRRTFSGADEVLVVVQYWLNDVMVVADVLYPAQLDTDPAYSRHVAQMNVLTYLIEHRDSNVGNFLISRNESGARVFSIDNGVAFDSEDSDRGMLWRDMRVKRLPADLVARLRAITPATLDAGLGVLAQWQLQDGKFIAVDPGTNLSKHQGVRRRGDTLQMGLRRAEIDRIQKLLAALLARIDRGELAIF